MQARKPLRTKRNEGEKTALSRAIRQGQFDNTPASALSKPIV